MNECTEAMFLKNVNHHSIQVLHDYNLYRHISCTNNGSFIYQFDLDTWPGGLCITGDCGTYVFRRSFGRLDDDDMFEFFRHPWPVRLAPYVQQGVAERKRQLIINPGYWGEKLESVGISAGYREFDAGVFTSRVNECFNYWKDYEKPTVDQANDMWDEIVDCVLSKLEEGENQSYQAIHDFSHDGFRFDDFFDSGGTERFTYRYLWCLYAIVWGIQQYDRYHKENTYE